LGLDRGNSAHDEDEEMTEVKITLDANDQIYFEWCMREATDNCYSMMVTPEQAALIRKLTPEQIRDFIFEDGDGEQGKQYVHDSIGAVGDVGLFTNKGGREKLHDLGNDPDDSITTANRMTVYEQLHDGLSDMIEGGRLLRESIPDDYQWLVEKLAMASGATPQPEPKTIDMAATISVKVARPDMVTTGNITIEREHKTGNGMMLHTFQGPDGKPTLEACQAIVEGDIEIVTVKADTMVPIGSQLIVNEQGCMAGQEPLPVNVAASRLYHSTCVAGTTTMIHGHAVLLVDGAQLT
jgi:hypothetical protein